MSEKKTSHKSIGKPYYRERRSIEGGGRLDSFLSKEGMGRGGKEGGKGWGALRQGEDMSLFPLIALPRRLRHGKKEGKKEGA